jgi:hypothetical protein
VFGPFVKLVAIIDGIDEPQVKQCGEQFTVGTISASAALD